MSIEQLLSELKRLDPYKTAILKQQLDAYNERKMLALVGRLLLAGMALFFWLLKG